MKIVCVVENFDDRYGGPSVSIPGLLESLRKFHGIKSIVVSVNVYGSETNSSISKDFLEWDNSSLLLGPKKVMFSLGFVKAIYRNVSRGDIVYINNLWNFVSLSAYLVARVKSARVIISPRGSLYEWSLLQSALLKKIALLLFQKSQLVNADAIHVTCMDEKEAVRAIGVCEDKIKIVSHGIDGSFDMSEKEEFHAKEQLGLDPSLKYFLFMSRLHKKKGLDVLLSIWSEISCLYPGWRLLIAGPDYDGYQDVITNNFSDSVVYLGHVSGLRKINSFIASEFLVLPSYSENFGVVIAESLLHGVPVITTNNTPWAAVSDKHCGACVDIREFKQTLISYLSKSRGELRLMGERGQAFVRNEYSWEAKSSEFYNRVLKDLM